MQEEQEESHIEHRGENRIEEVPWKEEPAKLHVMPEHANFYVTDQNVMPANLPFLNQAQLAKLLKMMVSDAWTTEVKCPLDFPDAHGLSVLEEEPVNFPCFASERVLQFDAAFRVQSD